MKANCTALFDVGITDQSSFSKRYIGALLRSDSGKHTAHSR
jgi:hypothetical protein